MGDAADTLAADLDAALDKVLRSESFRRTLDYWQDADEDPDRQALVKGILTRAIMGVFERPH